MYNSLIPGGRSEVVSSMLRTGRKAASVLPVAVGEMSTTFFPSRIFGIAFSWGSVGVENPRCSMRRRIGLTSMSNAVVFSASVNAARHPLFSNWAHVIQHWRLLKGFWNQQNNGRFISTAEDSNVFSGEYTWM
jgi:hypothetical protein